MTIAEKYNLTIAKTVPFLDNGKTIEFDDETVIETGTGNNDYIGFGNIHIKESNGKLFLVYYVGSDHAITHNARVAFRASTDHGYTWTASVFLKHKSQTQEIFGNIGGCSCFYNNLTGRLTVFFAGPLYLSESVTSVNIGSATDGLTLTLITPGVDLQENDSVTILSRANKLNRIRATVTSYDDQTGELVLDTLLKDGSGTFTDWDVVQTARHQQMHSDDEGATWGDPHVFEPITMVRPFVYGGPSTPIQFGEEIFRFIYGNDLGVADYQGWIYRSIDNCETWERWKDIYPKSVVIGAVSARPEEPTPFVRGDGLVIVLVRCDPVEGTYSIYTTGSQTAGGALLWSSFTRVSSSFGSNASAVSPNGTICGLGRDFDDGGRTIIVHSTDGGRVWSQQNADAREGEQEMGGMVWSTVANKFIAVYFAETGTPDTGACVAVCKRIDEVDA